MDFFSKASICYKREGWQGTGMKDLYGHSIQAGAQQQGRDSALGRSRQGAFPALPLPGRPHIYMAFMPPIPVLNPGLACLAAPPVARYPHWQRRSGVVLDLPFS